MANLFISAAHKSSGKTTISIGLCASLRQQGLIVQPFKKGPDYIDPLWLTSAAGRPCHNLDFHVMSRPELQATFEQHMLGVDIGIIEGNKGLYDGLDLDGGNSNAALAELLDIPVVLVIDARGMTRGIAPLILGYQAFELGIRIGAVILNQVGGYRHEEKLRRVIEYYTDVPVMGAVHHSSDVLIAERHLGLMPSNETREREEIITRIGAAVAEQVDFARLIALAEESQTVLPMSPTESLSVTPDLRIGIAQDAVFGFYYAGDLDALANAGAELVPFDTLNDASLPDVDGLFIGGGFPEVHMEALEKNSAMRKEIHDFIASGGPAYAECGGLMYLARSLNWRGKTCSMVGAVPADAVMHDRPQGRGYVKLRETGKSPWPNSVSKANEIAAHEFHYSELKNLSDEISYAYEMLRGTGIDGKNDGIVYKNLLASYTHLRDTEGCRWVDCFVAHVRNSI
ncbi:Protein similar to cobyrinic acid a,c-diamide synthetase clustered with dissimilatory sulfite reductase [hydrothermal vent metagenome]|uniref:Protein similar to cobyrinic acid a,c-diamide synthetase clustered with dissimilatory sulfite reductase n=1 Tax=hydrothermal vent metagenome TaxID=652676 RepID=A0A3B1AQ61_9ZZZZ